MAGVPLPKLASDGARMPFWASDGNFSSFWTKISDPSTWSLPKSASVGTEQDAIGGRFWYQKMPTDIDFGFWLPLEVDFGSTRAANGGRFCLMRVSPICTFLHGCFATIIFRSQKTLLHRRGSPHRVAGHSASCHRSGLSPSEPVLRTAWRKYGLRSLA